MVDFQKQQAQLAQGCEQAIDIAKKHGADEAWASTSRSQSQELHTRDGRMERVQDNTSRGLSLRLYVDGRYSSHGTTDLVPERLEAFIKEAVALTRHLEKDPHRKLVDPRLFASAQPEGLELLDPKVLELSHEERMAWCAAMNDQIAGHDRLISASCIAYDSIFSLASVGTNGFKGSWGGTSVGMYSMVTLQDEGDTKPADGMGVSTRNVEDLLSPEKIGVEALERTVARLGAKKGPTSTTTMVVDPKAASRLIAALIGPSGGYAIQQGQSFWAGKLGQKMVSDKLTLIDDPAIVRGLGSRPFDGEGITAKRRPMIENGVFRNYYLDSYYASKLGMEPTSGGGTNQILELGQGNLAEHLATAKHGVYVTSWLGGNSDPTTGDFSFGFGGHLIEDGKIGRPVTEMNITGNLLELFSNLVEVGDDPWKYSSTRTPTLVFKDVEFSGV